MTILVSILIRLQTERAEMLLKIVRRVLLLHVHVLLSVSIELHLLLVNFSSALLVLGQLLLQSKLQSQRLIFDHGGVHRGQIVLSLILSADCLVFGIRLHEKMLVLTGCELVLPHAEVGVVLVGREDFFHCIRVKVVTVLVTLITAKIGMVDVWRSISTFGLIVVIGLVERLDDVLELNLVVTVVEVLVSLLLSDLVVVPSRCNVVSPEVSLDQVLLALSILVRVFSPKVFVLYISSQVVMFVDTSSFVASSTSVEFTCATSILKILSLSSGASS
jgi:hypothetical protein